VRTCDWGELGKEGDDLLLKWVFGVLVLLLNGAKYFADEFPIVLLHELRPEAFDFLIVCAFSEQM
jgi:hypothetical protein